MFSRFNSTMPDADQIIEYLEKFNFTRTEASVYLNLVIRGSRNGSQIARDLNISRSSVYSALDNLYEKAVVYLLQSDSKTYKAEDPSILINRLKSQYVDSADSLKKALSGIQRKEEDTYYLNITGFENFISKARELLLSAEKEIYLNLCMDIQIFSEEFAKLKKKGVRVIVFSFSKLNCTDIPVEFYYNSVQPGESEEVRMMMVIDRKTSLIGSSVGNSEFIGTYSDNPLMVSIVSEHIHQDIYLMKLREKYGENLIDSNILLGTIQENQ